MVFPGNTDATTVDTSSTPIHFSFPYDDEPDAKVTNGSITITVDNLPAIEPIIRISSATGKAGGELTLAIALQNNPGIIAMCFSISFDEKSLRFEGFEDTGMLGGPTHSPTTAPGASPPIWFTWEDGLATVDNTVDGDIVKLRFRVLEDTMPGEYNIELTYEPGDILNSMLSPVGSEVVSGKITVVKDTGWAIANSQGVPSPLVVALRRGATMQFTALLDGVSVINDLKWVIEESRFATVSPSGLVVANKLYVGQVALQLIDTSNNLLASIIIRITV
jgi:hypothetical protein